MVSLNFNYPVFYCTSGSAALFELFSQSLYPFRIKIQAGDQGDSLAFAPLGFTLDADNAVTFVW